MSTLHNLQKTQRGGVALRATFAALIALGSIPGAVAITPNLVPAAFAATNSDTVSNNSDIENLTGDFYEIVKDIHVADNVYNIANDDYSFVDKFKSNDGLKNAATNALKKVLSDKLNNNDYVAEIPLKGSYKTIHDAVTSSKTNSASYYQLIADISNEDITQLTNLSPDYYAWNLNKASAHILELVKDNLSATALCKSEKAEWKTSEVVGEDGHERNVTYSLYVANPDDYKNWTFPDKKYENEIEEKLGKYNTYSTSFNTIMLKSKDFDETSMILLQGDTAR